MNIKRIAIVFCFSMLWQPLIFAGPDIIKLSRETRPGIVLIETFDEFGDLVGSASGFFYNSEGNVVTNHHVIEGAWSATVKTHEDVILPVIGVIAESQECDLAVLIVELSHITVHPLPINYNMPDIGEDVIVVGNPQGLEATVSSGIVSGIRESEEFGKVIQITAPISAGSSGSPVLNTDGEVIGIATYSIKYGQALNFAIPTQRLLSVDFYDEGIPLSMYYEGHVTLSQFTIRQIIFHGSGPLVFILIITACIFFFGFFLFAHDTKKGRDSSSTLVLDETVLEWNLAKKVRRYLGAILAFLIYWMIAWGCISRITGAVLSSKEAADLVEIGILTNIWEYGWGDHYIWFLLMFCVVTYLVAFMSGATAKRKGGFTAVLASIPIFLMVLLVSYWLLTDDKSLTAKLAWQIVVPISAVASLFCSYIGGIAGESTQNSEFKENTILGIRSYHFFWLWLILGPYIQCLWSAFIPFILFTFWQGDIWLSFVLVWFPLICYGYPLFLMYEILSGAKLSDQGIIIRISSFVGLYIGGLVVGSTVHFLCNLLLR